ncbi:MAG: hypothetical protein PHV48_04320 [Candidatus Omnitrophica bacterium]|nr:hypothetical protein [Candidatus Omnitrophota bacterium]
MKKYFVCIVMISAMMILSPISAFSEDPQASVKDSMADTQMAQADSAEDEAPAKINEFSIYGEIQTVNTQASSLSIQYYDYDSDEEKTLEVTLDKDTKLENVKTIDQMKKGDWADITYTAIAGKNMAKLVSVEVEDLPIENNAPINTTE